METLLTDQEFRERERELRGKRWPVLSHGFIALVEATGSDRRIVEAARCTSDIGSKGDADDRNLIRYLMRHRHSTPREFCDITWLISCPMDTWRQAIRHRTFSTNEFSSRYSEVPDVNDETPPDKWRKQSQSNRQGSSAEFVTEWPEGYEFDSERGEVLLPPRKAGQLLVSSTDDRDGLDFVPGVPGTTPGEYLSERERMLHDAAREIYKERLEEFGVAKEQARKDLCLSTYTRAYWKANLHNTLHFLGLRCDSHAQWEIRQYANQMLMIMQQLYPVTMAAFLDYQLNAMTLTALDQYVIEKLLHYRQFLGDQAAIDDFMACQHPDWKDLKNCREREECLHKLVKLGIVAP